MVTALLARISRLTVGEFLLVAAEGKMVPRLKIGAVKSMFQSIVVPVPTLPAISVAVITKLCGPSVVTCVTNGVVHAVAAAPSKLHITLAGSESEKSTARLRALV